MKKTALPLLNYRENLSGQSIVEVVLSIGVAALVIGALVILGSSSLRTALSSARRTEATRLAVSGLEAMRYYRDTTGFSSLQEGCYQISTSGEISGIGADGSADRLCTDIRYGWQTLDLQTSSSKAIFERKIEVRAYGTTAENTRMRKVTTTVKWPEGSGESVGGDANQRQDSMTVVLSEW